MTSSASPWGDQPPTTCHAGAARRIRSPPPAVAASTTSMSVVARAFDEKATVRPSGEAAFHERSRCTLLGGSTESGATGPSGWRT